MVCKKNYTSKHMSNPYKIPFCYSSFLGTVNNFILYFYTYEDTFYVLETCMVQALSSMLIISHAGFHV